MKHISSALDSIERARQAQRELREQRQAEERAEAAERAAREADPAYAAQLDQAARRHLLDQGFPRAMVTGADLEYPGLPRHVRKDLLAWATAQPLQTLIIAGGYGIGKSYAAVLAAIEARKVGYSCRYVCEMDIAGSDDAHEADIACGLLVIDELAADTEIAVWRLDAVKRIINARYRERRSMVITTNDASRRALASRYGDYIADRLCDTTRTRRPVTWGVTVSARSGIDWTRGARR